MDARQVMGGIQFSTQTLIDGTAITVAMGGCPVPCTLWARPAAGDTVSISYSCDGGTTYTAWPAGGVTAYAEDILDAPVTHIKGQRTAGSGTTSAFGVC